MRSGLFLSLGIVKVMIDRHGQKVPMAYAYPVLEWAAKAHRSVTLCVDLVGVGVADRV